MSVTLKRVSLLLLIFVLVVSGCASYEAKPFPIVVPRELPLFQFAERYQLTVGVEPLLTPDANRKFLGNNVRSKDLLPILVSYENQSDSSFVVYLSDIKLISHEGQEVPLASFDEVFKHLKKSYFGRLFGSFVAGAGIAVGTFGILAVAIIVLPLLSAFNVSDVNDTIKTDLRGRILSAGGSFHAKSSGQGMLFFKLKKKKKIDGYVLKLDNIRPVRQSAGTARMNFEFRF